MKISGFVAATVLGTAVCAVLSSRPSAADVLSVGLPGRANSTGEAETTIPVSTQDGIPLTDLKSALAVTAWDASTQGPILAIAPELISHASNYQMVDGEYRLVDELYTPREGHGLRLDTVARYFKRHVVRLPSLAVIVPNEMIVLNTHLKAPDIYANLQPYEKIQVLQATLSARQWQLLGSPEGLGLADLTRKQQPLFLGILPENPCVTKTRNAPNPESPIGVSRSQVERKDLSDEEREQIRLRLDRTSNIFLLDSAAKYPVGFINATNTEPEEIRIEQATNPAGTSDSLFGQPVRLRVPNRPKPGQLDCAAPALDAVIESQSSHTVGDLVGLVRAKSGVDVYVDGRLASLPVYVSRTEHGVRCGDVLQALCLALTGTVRRIGPTAVSTDANKADVAYVLTNDLEGVGARLVTIQDWVARAQGEKTRLALGQNAAIRAANPMQYISSAPGDSMAPTPDIMRRIEDGWSAPGSFGQSQADVSIGDLTAGQRQVVRRAMESYAERVQANPDSKMRSANPGLVRVSLMLTLSYIIPGFGTARTGNAFMNSEFIAASRSPSGSSASIARAPTEVLPPASLPGATVAFAPHSLTDVTAVMDVAKAKGIYHIWIESSWNPEGLALLEQAVTLGKSREISVSALVPLMAAPQSEDDTKLPSGYNKNPGPLATQPVPIVTSVQPENPALDRNIRGETGRQLGLRTAWEQENELPHPSPFVGMAGFAPPARPEGDILAPESPGVLALEVQRLEQIAAIPGIAAIAVKDTAEPGHQPAEPKGFRFPGTEDPDNDFGYTAANRIRFLRAQGFDPIDLWSDSPSMVDGQMKVSTALPYMNTNGSGSVDMGLMPESVPPSLSGDWNRLRKEEQTTFLRDLNVEVRKYLPDFPIYRLDTVPTANSNGTYIPWKPELPPATPPPLAAAPAPANTRRGFACYAVTPLTKERFLWMISIYDQNRAARTDAPAGRGAQGQRPQSSDLVLDFSAISIAETLTLLRDNLANSP